MFIIFLGIKSINLTNISRQGYNKSFNTFLNELWLFLPSSPSNAFILSFDSGSSTTIATVALELDTIQVFLCQMGMKPRIARMQL